MLSQFAPLVPERRQIDDTGQIGLQETCLLTTQSQPHTTQAGLTAAQFLGEPSRRPEPLQLMGDDRRMTYYFAQVVPDDGIQLMGWDEPGRAVLLPIGGHRRQLASAYVVLVVRDGMNCAPGATQLAAPAADQAAE